VKRKELPEEWEWRKLGDLIELKYGKGLREADRNEEGNITVYGSNGPVGWHDTPLSNTAGIIVGRKGSVGAVHKSEGSFWAIDTTYYIEPINSLDLSYLYYLLKTLNLNLLDKSTSIPGLNRNDVYRKNIPVPPLDTQRKIVAILDKAEATQRLRAEADALMQQLVQSVYISIFGDPVSNPQGWDIVSLESVCKKITDGEHVTPKRTQSGIYLLSARNIKDHEIDLSDVDYIDQDEYNRISKRIIPQKGDVLISCSGSVGRVSQVTDDMKFQMVRSVALIRPDNQKLDSTYLEYTFDTNYLKAQIAQSVNQSSQANLFQNKIRKLRIPVPPMHLQKIFVDVAVRKGRISEKQRLNSTKTQTLYNSLLSKAFTGELVP